MNNVKYKMDLLALKNSLEFEIRNVNSNIRVLGGLINRYKKNNLAKHQDEQKAHRNSLKRILDQVKRNLEDLENGQV